MKENKTQLRKVKAHIINKGFITSWDAITKYRITRLSAYIHLLRESVMEIKSERVYPPKSNWYTLYKL